MKTLQIDTAYTLLRLRAAETSTQTLTEQARPYFERSARLLLDVDGIHFNSMLIGELVNLYRRFNEHWKEHTHRIALVRPSSTTRDVIERVRLNEYFDLYDSYDEALSQLGNGSNRTFAREEGRPAEPA